MLNVQGGSDDHDIFKKRCALAASGSLAPAELSELRAHLERCEECREIFLQYRILTTHGISSVADVYAERFEEAAWDGANARERLMERVGNDRQMLLHRKNSAAASTSPKFLRRAVSKQFAKVAIAAGLILAVASGAYHLGLRKQAQAEVEVKTAPNVADGELQQLVREKNVAGDLSAAQTKKISELQLESSAKQREIDKLQSALHAVETRSSELAAANSQSAEQLRLLTQQRAEISAQLQSVTQAYENDRTELASLRSERDTTQQQASALEAKIADLSATNRDQERRLKDAEQYLTSDRDIRELMGARKLYIADVFDVDGSSRTKKPFGRVFYTQGKSLIFYAFDLDREPGVVNASTFQVWGQREGPEGEQPLPMNLGILYMDNESNRRWVLRFDDPKQLAEIDAVFVTIEPRGGSHKPTSKPFLYALLRKEVNHP
jgi:Anti-sigma-K factor rskA